MQQVPSDAAAGTEHKAKPPRKIVAASKSKAVKTASQKPARRRFARPIKR